MDVDFSHLSTSYSQIGSSFHQVRMSHIAFLVFSSTIHLGVIEILLQAKDLHNSLQNIKRIIEKQNSKQVVRNRLQFKVSIDVIKWLVFQGCAFRGHNETQNSRNEGNFLEVIKLLASYNEYVGAIILENGILSILANSNFCIIVDEAHNESKKEQIVIVLWFVNKEGFIHERFFDLVHVKDTTSLALEKAIRQVLLLHCLNVDDIHGQGYDYNTPNPYPSPKQGCYNDGASNMRGECNGLQALFAKKCQFAYYVHYLTHRLQLTLVAASKEVIPICQLRYSMGSHLDSLNSWIRMFNSVCVVLQDIIKFGNLTQRNEVDGIYDALASIKFVFILHFMIALIRITDDLCQALQYKSHDILTQCSWCRQLKCSSRNSENMGGILCFKELKLFCKDYEIEVPNLSAPYKAGRGRSCIPRDNVTIEHHYRLDIFIVGIDSLLTEMNSPFNGEVVKLFALSSALDPHDNYKGFPVEDIYKLMNYFYPDNYTEQEKLHSTELQKASIVVELRQVLAKTNKSSIYHLLDRIIRLVLTLPVSTTTTERAFSAMKNVKTMLHNRMEDDFHSTYLVAYIEKEIA
ncbi:hypothetical protein V6Z11_A11G278200 [Gossypium hirsutum]